MIIILLEFDQHELGFFSFSFFFFLQDIGCGVGGPAREIAKFSGAKIIGLNCSKYQVKRAQMHTAKSNQEDSISYVEVCVSSPLLIIIRRYTWGGGGGGGGGLILFKEQDLQKDSSFSIGQWCSQDFEKRGGLVLEIIMLTMPTISVRLRELKTAGKRLAYQAKRWYEQIT